MNTKRQTTMINGEQYQRVDTSEEFERLARDFGYENPTEFEKWLGIEFTELRGHWFIIVHDRVFFA